MMRSGDADGEKQIPFGNDSKKGKCNSNGFQAHRDSRHIEGWLVLELG